MNKQTTPAEFFKQIEKLATTTRRSDVFTHSSGVRYYYNYFDTRPVSGSLVYTFHELHKAEFDSGSANYDPNGLRIQGTPSPEHGAFVKIDHADDGPGFVFSWSKIVKLPA